MPGALALFAVHSYVAAEAYAQTGGFGVPLQAPSVNSQALPIDLTQPSSVFFAAGSLVAESQGQAADGSPYRSSQLLRYPQSTLPQAAVDYMINQASFTGLYFSLFRHGPAWDAEGYEVRPGSPTDCDRSILGGTGYDPEEEAFFDVTWVAHVHPPHASPLPSDADLDAIAERARISGTRHARHVLFGFHAGEPVSVDLRALWDPIFRSAALLHRSSSAIALETDLRIQEWLAL